MRFSILCALLLVSLAWAKDPPRPFTHEGRGGSVRLLREASDPQQAIDLVIVADGYSASKKERKRFEGDAKTLLKLFKTVEPFESYRGLFRVHAVFLPTPEDQPTQLDVEIPHPEPRNLMTFEVAELRAILTSAGLADAELVHVLHDVDRFGGSAYSGEGISISSRNAGELNDVLNMGLLYTVAHELGHSVAGLVEERPGPGLGAERELLAQAGALPNAWAPPDGGPPSAEYAPWAAWLPDDPEVVPHDDGYPYSPTFKADKRPVGFFAGAASMPGAYRAQEHCLMRSDTHRFCVLCREALVRAFFALSTPLRLEGQADGEELELRARSGVPTKHRRLRWEVPGASPEVAERVARANAEQLEVLRLPLGSKARCTLEDRTPFVRGARPTASAVWPSEPTQPGQLTGAASALQGLGH